MQCAGGSGGRCTGGRRWRRAAGRLHRGVAVARRLLQGGQPARQRLRRRQQKGALSIVVAVIRQESSGCGMQWCSECSRCSSGDVATETLVTTGLFSRPQCSHNIAVPSTGSTAGPRMCRPGSGSRSCGCDLQCSQICSQMCRYSLRRRPGWVRRTRSITTRRPGGGRSAARPRWQSRPRRRRRQRPPRCRRRPQVGFCPHSKKAVLHAVTVQETS